MRDLRALLQVVHTLICTKHNLEIGEKPDITKLTGKLKSNDLFNYEFHNHLLAHSSTANLSSHGAFPSANDLSDRTIRNRFFISFDLGCYLIVELEKIINS